MSEVNAASGRLGSCCKVMQRGWVTSCGGQYELHSCLARAALKPISVPEYRIRGVVTAWVLVRRVRSLHRLATSCTPLASDLSEETLTVIVASYA